MEMVGVLIFRFTPPNSPLRSCSKRMKVVDGDSSNHQAHALVY